MFQAKYYWDKSKKVGINWGRWTDAKDPNLNSKLRFFNIWMSEKPQFDNFNSFISE